MYRYLGKAAFIVLVTGCLWSGPVILAQQAKLAAPPGSVLSPERALSLAEQGRCGESISGLKRAMTSQVPAPTRKQAGVVGVGDHGPDAVDVDHAALEDEGFAHGLMVDGATTTG